MSWVFGGPGIALISSFFAIGGADQRQRLQLSAKHCLFLICFALPGQLVAAELYAAGSGLLVVTATVLLVNCRLLPMTVVLLPLLKDPGQPGAGGASPLESADCALGRRHQLGSAIWLPTAVCRRRTVAATSSS